MTEIVKSTKENNDTAVQKPSIYSLELQQLKDWAEENGEKAFRGEQIYEWLYKKRVKGFDEMTNLSKALRDQLEEQFTFTTLNTLIQQKSSDGTMKFLFELQDGY